MQIAVCDDNLRFLTELEGHLRALPMVTSVSAFSALERFLFSVEEGAQYDGVFMDLHWGKGETGMDAAEVLLRLSPRSRIVYMTGYSERYVQQIFLRQSNLSGYLTKPIDPALLLANLEKILREREREQPALTLISQGKTVTIPLEEILYIESRNHTVWIHTQGEDIPAYRRLDDVEQLLSAGFFRCHKSFLVNLRQIQRLEQPDLLLKTGHKVPVSRARYSAARAAYLKFVGQSF